MMSTNRSGDVFISAVTVFRTYNITTDSTAKISSNCVLTSSSDGSGDLISPETELLINKLKSAVIIPVLFAFAGPTNLFSIAVFFQQGLRDRVNLCLFSLAIVDFAIVSFYFVLFGEQMFMFSSYETYGVVWTFLANNKSLLFYSCVHGSMFLSVLISVERCICVLFPLRAKLMFKTQITAAIILIVVPVVCFLRLAVTAKYIVVCLYDTRTKRMFMSTFVTDYALKNKEFLDVLDGIFYGLIMGLGCPIVILICTAITTAKLWQTVAWRKGRSSASSRNEVAVTKMLILLSLEFLIFALPRCLVRIYALFNPEFSAKGKYRYFFLAGASIAEIFICMGSSFSFIIYYVSSSRYRKTFHSIVYKCCFVDNLKKLARKTSNVLENAENTQNFILTSYSSH